MRTLDIRLRLKNYRCFPAARPVDLFLQPGFTSLVGSNNSGKSSLLRFLYEFRPVFGAMRSGNLMTAISTRDGNMPQAADTNEIFSNNDVGNLEFELSATSDGRSSPTSLGGPDLFRVVFDRNVGGYSVVIALSGQELHPAQSHDLAGQVVRENQVDFADLTYLREGLDILQNCFYIGPFRNAINLGGSGNYFDIQTGQNFISLWGQAKSGTDRNLNRAALRVTEDIKRIFEFTSFEINETAGGDNLQVIVDGAPYRLDEQGSGLAHFVIVLASVALRGTRPSYILIDEPELGLHPSLQTDFLMTLASYASEGVVFATHSLGLARSLAHRIYSHRRIVQGESEVREFEATTDLAEFLGELSYSAYRDVGFSHVLLVEGPHDLRTVQQWLRQYHKEHQVVLLPLGGAQNINKVGAAQLEEVKRITDRVAALIDSERTAAGAPLEKRIQDFMKACAAAKVRCKILDLRATENYFSDRAIKLVKGSAFRALQPFEKLDDVQPHWRKVDNWRIARVMTKDELDATDLGPFLGSL